MDVGLYKLKDFKNNKKTNVTEIKWNLNNDSYSLDQYNKWIDTGNKEENVNPIINNKLSKYNLTCYGNWLGVKNYNEKYATICMQYCKKVGYRMS